MANPQDLEKLCQGPKVWNAWREEQYNRVPDLRNASLTLSQRQFGPSNGGPIDLQDTDLEGAEFRHATLTGANLQRANLVAADLVHARLDGASLAGADLTDAVLDYADLTGASLDGAILIGASLANVRGLTADQIVGTHGDASTVLPGDMLPPDNWFPPLDEDILAGFPAPAPVCTTDPYEVLGVDQGAPQDVIRTAFRNLVKQVHPDLNPGDAEAQETFKRVSSAYRILNDPDKRARYDRGEIGGDGEVTAEFEAKQHFRRYARRFYATAGASLVLAVGVLVVVWYSVLTQPEGDRNRVELTVAARPKQAERLGSKIESLVAEPAAVAQPEADEKAGSEKDRSDDRQVPPADAGPGADRAASASAPEDAPVVPSPAAQAPVAEQTSEPKAAAVEAETAPVADAGPSQGEPVSKAASVESDIAGDKSKPAVVEAAPVKTAAADAGSLAVAVPDPDITAAPAPEATAGSAPSAAPEAPSAEADAPQTSPKPTAVAPEPQGEKIASLTEEVPSGPPAASEPAAEKPAPAETSEPPAPAASETPPATGNPPPAAALGSDQKDAARPLGEQNSEKEARPADADAAGSVAPASASDEKAIEEKQGADRPRVASQDPSQDLPREFLLRQIQTGALINDPISQMFKDRAIRNALAPIGGQATASVGASGTQDDVTEQEEVWDVYTHSLPDAVPGETRQWPEILNSKKPKRALASPPPASIPVPARVAVEKAPPPQHTPPQAAARKRAVSDILAGGL